MLAPYFALRIVKVAEEKGTEAGRAYYSQIFTIPTYKPFQEETDAILVLKHPELIVVA